MKPFEDCPSGKLTYRKERAALKAVRVAAERGELPPMRHYECRDCGRFHLTSQPLPGESGLTNRWDYFCAECDASLDARECGDGSVVLSCAEHGDLIVAAISTVSPQPTSVDWTV